MAGPLARLAAIAAGAMGWEPEKILQSILFIVLLPIAILAIFFVSPMVITNMVPMASIEQLQVYLEASSEVKERYELDESSDWMRLVAIDAVRLKQDFSQTSKIRAVSLAERFVGEREEIFTETTTEGEEIERSHIVHYLKDFETVLNELSIFGEEGERVNTFLEGLEQTFYYIMPEGWEPREKIFLWPLSNYYRVSSPYGPRTDPMGEAHIQFHNGIDLPAPLGTPVYATKKGTVIRAGRIGDAGLAVIMEHDHGYETRYYHLNSIAVNGGAELDKGDVIGTVGSTGRSTGPHLHFEIRRYGEALDPLIFY